MTNSQLKEIREYIKINFNVMDAGVNHHPKLGIFALIADQENSNLVSILIFARRV
jgi:hypothetical protein